MKPGVGPFCFLGVQMAGESVIPIGILFSRSGPYAEPGQEGFDGAMAAIDEVNRDGTFPFSLDPVIRDPQGNTDRYAPFCREMVGQAGVRHVVGCTTSWSRKEVIPVVEKMDALLWYPCVYEGFEASENVVYVAACANQHLLPLLDYIIPRFGRDPLLLGSNYIWGWETNRIAREVVTHSGGTVLAERYVPIGDSDIAHLIAEIRAKRPDFILNNLIGSSSYAFLRAYHALGLEDPSFRPESRPVISCNLYEGEIADLGGAAAGHYSVSCYFQSLQTEENRLFLERIGAANRTQPVTAFFAESYASVLMIANAIRSTGADAIEPVLSAVTTEALPSPFGNILVDRRTNHVAMPAHIARAGSDGAFEVVHEAQSAIEPDPFLTRTRFGVPTNDQSEQDDKSGFLRVVR